MYIIQMADLHIGSAVKTEPSEKKILAESIKLIRHNIPEKSKVLLCLCGDIIDSGVLAEKRTEKERKKKVKDSYTKAAELLNMFKKELGKYCDVIAVRCCPGNHDITHEEEFAAFAGDAGGEEIPPESLKSCYVYEPEGENTACVFVNSCDGDQYSIGRIDYEKLEALLAKLPPEQNKIIVLHHTIMSMFEDDASPIRNAAKLISLVDRYNIIGILHGHIHGREILKVGQNQCKVIGTGALFARNNPNINSQFNIIEYRNGTILKILNCRYNADGGNEPWGSQDLGETPKNHVFEGRSFKGVYEQLLNRLAIVSPLDNVSLVICEDYDKFKLDLRKYLSNDRLKIGKRKYSYLELAKMWEAETVPRELYFNHGSCFYMGKRTGVEFVRDQLSKKPTSNRIVLSTFNTEQVYGSLDDSSYLPSLTSLQFGMDEKGGELSVHMHLRALDAGRFLKINICEIDYFLTELRKRGIRFDRVKIVITAFRVQIREKFGCFLKAQIDDLSPAKLSVKVSQARIEELCTLLEEKLDCCETITKTSGIKTVYEAMCELKTEEPAGLRYPDEILELFGKVLGVYSRLDELHRRGSIRGEEEKDCEQEINVLLQEIIGKLREFNRRREQGGDGNEIAGRTEEISGGV